VRQNRTDSERQVADLQTQLEDANVWKEKYERLRGQAQEMKNQNQRRSLRRRT